MSLTLAISVDGLFISLSVLFPTCKVVLLGFSRSRTLNLVSDLQLEASLVHGKQTKIFLIFCQSSLYFSSHQFDSRISVAKVF